MRPLGGGGGGGGGIPLPLILSAVKRSDNSLSVIHLIVKTSSCLFYAFYLQRYLFVKPIVELLRSVRLMEGIVVRIADRIVVRIADRIVEQSYAAPHGVDDSLIME
ncbi:unnamed protein product [Sphagnum jensenii]|uniref:Uncharacterized protein n=1 Tax=Sphagnum jensenii TaxID=128206 RepID=A0ABP0VH56_9BRYO